MDFRPVKISMILFFIMTLFSCSVNKYDKLNKEDVASISLNNILTETESNIINTFIDMELKKDRYKNYKDFEIVVIEEALQKRKSIETYKYSRDEWISMNRINKNGDLENRFLLDTLQIKKIEIKLEKEDVYKWKISDFKYFKVNLLKYEELKTIINTGLYSKFSSRIIIYLSKPLIIDENNAFISFEVGDGQLGFHSINHFTVLMRKVNSRWEQVNYYYDGVFN